MVYTPSGYFADSVGADSLLRFVENTVPSKLPTESFITRFNKQFHRPDIVSRILDTLDESKAVEEANAAMKAGPKKKR